MSKFDIVKQRCDHFKGLGVGLSQNPHQRLWRSQENKDLINLVLEGRLNIDPSTILHLDNKGLNFLEIMLFDGAIGKKLISLPPATRESLCDLEEKFGFSFVAHSKKSIKTIRLDTCCAEKQPDGSFWQIFSLLDLSNPVLITA